MSERARLAWMPRMEGASERLRTWGQVLRRREIWLRAALVSAPVGLLQVAINQGDYWLTHQVTTGVWIKTVATPLVTLAVAIASAAGVAVDRELKRRKL